MKAHPEVDCLVGPLSPEAGTTLRAKRLTTPGLSYMYNYRQINNAGVQRPLDVNNFDLQKADQEIAINISGPMHLAIEMLDHLKVGFVD